MIRRTAAFAASVLAICAGVLALTGQPSHAANPPTRFTLDAIGASSSNPFGQALNANNWGGTGSASVTCGTGAGVVNDNVGVWKNSGAGCASDWQIVANTTPVNTFEIEYNPGGNTSASLCVSTIANLTGTRARLRPCSFTGTNPWQTFIRVPEPNSDITGGFEIEAALTTTQCAGGPCVLNDLRYAQNNAMSIAVWPNTHTVNEIFQAH